MIIQDKETLSLIINLSIASARLRNIEIEEPKAIFNMRPQIHTLLSGDPGSNKSTVLTEVAAYFKSRPWNEITEAALIGSVDKQTHQFTEGAAWSSRNSIFVIDEFEFLDSSRHATPLVKKLLSLTEGEQYFKRKTSIQCAPIKEKDGDLFLKVDKGIIEMKTNFSLMLGTMSKLNFMSQQLQALKTRCIPINWKPDASLILDVAHGEKIFKYKDLLIEHGKNAQKCHISCENYMKIVHFVAEKAPPNSLFLRIIGDLCRVFAILKRHDFDVYELIYNMKLDVTKR